MSLRASIIGRGLLREHPLEEEFPTVELLQQVAEGYEGVTTRDDATPPGFWLARAFGIPAAELFAPVLQDRGAG